MCSMKNNREKQPRRRRPAKAKRHSPRPGRTRISVVRRRRHNVNPRPARLNPAPEQPTGRIVRPRAARRKAPATPDHAAAPPIA